MVVVAEHGEGGCAEAAHELADQSHAALLTREVVPRQHHQIGLESVRDRDGIADALGWRPLPDVDVRELGHPQAVVRRVEAVNHEDPMLGLGRLQRACAIRLGSRRGRTAPNHHDRRCRDLEEFSSAKTHSPSREALQYSALGDRIARAPSSSLVRMPRVVV